MTAVTNDAPVLAAAGPRTRAGLGFALASAAAFGLSGALARPLLAAGWSPGAVVLVRILVGAAVVVPFGLRALRGQWHVLARNARLVTTYGVLAVAGAQFCYFSAVAHMQVGPALLIEYTAPAAVVLWLWLRHGQRPGPLTVAGAVVCAVGLMLVLDLFSGADLSVAGVLWALAAMVGAASYFLISADESTGLPPITLAAAGLVIGGAALGVLGLVGLLPLDAVRADVAYAGVDVAWWVPLALLGVVTAAFAYVTGIAAVRRLGSRLASFVALSEVIAGVLWSWVLLDELPAPVQIAGGALVLLGVVAVKLGEKEIGEVDATPEPSPA